MKQSTVPSTTLGTRPVYTVREVSELLGINRNFVYRLIEKKILTGMKLGNMKVTHTALTEFLNKYDGCDFSDLDNIIKKLYSTSKHGKINI